MKRPCASACTALFLMPLVACASADKASSTKVVTVEQSVTEQHRLDPTRSPPDDHPDLQHARTLLATTIYAQGDLQGSLALRKRVVETLEDSLLADHPDPIAAKRELAKSMSLTAS